MKKALWKRCGKDKKTKDTCKDSNYMFDAIERANKINSVVGDRREGVDVRVASALIPEEYEDLRTAFIDQLSDTFMNATQTGGPNCYLFDRTSMSCLFCKSYFCAWPDDRGQTITWCNAPEYVRMSLFDTQAAKEVAHMKVELKFQGTTDKGKFDCVGIMSSVDQNARDNRQGELMKIVGGKEVGTMVTCSSNEVSGSCPNPDCLYKLGACFEK